MSEPMHLWLPQNCANCQHFDGEHWCTLLLKETLIPGYIVAPDRVVCTKHQPQEAEIEGASV